MDRRTRNLFALLFAAVVAVTGGAALLLSETTTPTDPDAPPLSSEPTTPDPDAPPSMTAVTGVIVAVDSQGLADVRGITLRVEGGDLLEFDLSELENGAELPPGHLVEHQATADPVRILYREDGGIRLAIRIDDAPR